MPRPRIRSGQPLGTSVSVRTPIAMMPRLMITSLRAASQAARVMEPPWSRWRSRSTAQIVLITTAPPAVRISDSGSGASGFWNLAIACQSAATAGSRMMPAIALPATERWARGQPSATKISRLTAVSSRKSTESANSETEPIARATAFSTKK